MSAFFEITLLVLLVVFAAGSAAAKNILASLIIYMPYSIVMACTLFTLRSPDLAITKASVDVGITLILFFLTLNKVHAIPLHTKKISIVEENTVRRLHGVADWFRGTSRAKRLHRKKRVKKEVTIGRAGKININMNAMRKLGRFTAVAAFLGVVAVMLVMCAHLPGFGVAQNPANNAVSARYIEKSVEETGSLNVVTAVIFNYRALDTFAEATILFTTTIAVVYLLKAEKTQGDETRYEREKFE
jgi:multicomponent Na+:H+ antiporter subunit B